MYCSWELSSCAEVLQLRSPWSLLPLPASAEIQVLAKGWPGLWLPAHLAAGSPVASDPSSETWSHLWRCGNPRDRLVSPFRELVKSAGQLICCKGFCEQFDNYCSYLFRCKCFVIMKVLVQATGC